jgi:hypothetical protein
MKTANKIHNMRKLILLSFLILLPMLGSGETTTIEKETTVLICTGKHATKYHKKKCRGLKNCKAKTKEITLSKAREDGYNACKICYK